MQEIVFFSLARDFSHSRCRTPGVDHVAFYISYFTLFICVFTRNDNKYIYFLDAEDFEPGDFKNKPSDRWDGEDEDDVKVKLHAIVFRISYIAS